jgi:hypothetical protein
MATHSQGTYTKYKTGRYQFTARQVSKAESCGDVDKHYPTNLYGKDRDT